MASWTPQVSSGDVIEAGHINGLRDNTVRKATSKEGQNFYTQGSIPFADGSGFMDEDNTNLSWDNTNKELSVGGAVLPKWTKFTIAETALTDADTSEDETLVTIAQFEKIHAVTIKHSAAFTGGTLTAMTVSVGVASDPDFYAPAFDIFQAVGDQVFQDTNVFGSFTMAAAGHAVIAQFNSTGDNVANATSGSVDIWLLVSKLP